MQTVLTYLTLLITGVMLHAQNSVEVTLTHFNSDEGMARVGLYNNPSDFLNKEFKTLETTIQNGGKHNFTLVKISRCCKHLIKWARFTKARQLGENGACFILRQAQYKLQRAS